MLKKALETSAQKSNEAHWSRRIQFTTRTLFTVVTGVACVLAGSQQLGAEFVITVTLPFCLVLFVLACLVSNPTRLALTFAFVHTLAAIPMALAASSSRMWAAITAWTRAESLDLQFWPVNAAIHYVITWLAAFFGADEFPFSDSKYFWFFVLRGGIVSALCGYLIARFSLIRPRHI